MHRSLVAAAALVTLAAASGCLSPYLKAAPDVPAPKPGKALLAGFVVHIGDNPAAEKKSLAAGLIDAAQNAGLDEFGKKATDRLKSALAERGYEVAFDQARSSKLDAVEIASNAGTAALTGQWRHPETSYWVPQTVDSLFVKPADIVGKIKTDQKEFFAFADVSIIDAGMFMKEPHIVVRATVYDQDARKVLDLQGLGEGESTFLLSNRSPDNLDTALSRAFDSLKAVKEEPLS